jgi:uncharacterized lipoprotein YajG
MKKFVVLIVGSATLFAGCGSQSESPKVATPDVAQDMTQFNADLGAYMTSESHKVNHAVTATADCDPLNTAGATNCQITLTGIGNQVDHATAKNVRRTGNTFVWDRDS